MEIIDHISPAPKWVPPPDKPKIFKSEYEKTKYWEGEKKLWREGYGEGYAHLCGMHYYYLTQGTLKDGSDANYIRPKYRDCDEWIIDDLHKGFWGLGHHTLLIKRREIGATSMGAGLLPSYSTRMFPNSKFGMTSCDRDRIFTAFSDKTEPFIKELDLDIRPTFDKGAGYKENATKSQIYQKLPYLVLDQYGEPAYNYAEIWTKETSDTDDAASGFSSTRLRSAYFDEFPLHKRKGKLLRSSKPCFMKGMEQSGFLFAAGTVEEMKPEQIQELQEIINKKESYGFHVIFAPAWWGLKIDKNGVSDEKAGVEWVMSEREKYQRNQDAEGLKASIKNYPLSWEEVFELGKGERFEDDVVDMISHQVNVVSKKEIKPKAYTIATVSGRTEAYPANNSPVTILELPKPNIKYWIGIDGTATGEMSGSGEDRSEIACVVSKMYDPDESVVPSFCPVAIYHELPKSIEQSYYKIANVGRLYNQYGLAMFCAEGNSSTSEHFGNFLVKEGLKKMIMLRKDLSGKGNVNKTKWFNYRNDATLDWQYRQANIMLRKYIGGFYFLELLQQMQLPVKTNADIVDAWLWCLVGMGAEFDRPVVSKTYNREVVQNILQPDGRFRRIVMQVPYDPKHSSIPKEKTEDQGILIHQGMITVIDNKKINNFLS